VIGLLCLVVFRLVFLLLFIMLIMDLFMVDIIW